MKIELSYVQMNVIREILREERYRIWNDKHLPLYKGNDHERVYKILITEQRNPWCREGVITTILDEIDKMETMVQEEMRSLV